MPYFGAQMPLPLQLVARCTARHSVNRSFDNRSPCSLSAHAAKDAHVPAVTPAPETATWDPEGLLSRIPAAGGHFARRERNQGG